MGREEVVEVDVKELHVYMCACLQEQEELLREWMDFLKPVKKLKGKLYLDLLPGNDRAKASDV